jgi:exodeoxyribonuclease V alpha subunit
MAFGNASSSHNPREQMVAERRLRDGAVEAEAPERLEVFIGKVTQVVVSKPETGFFVAKMAVPKGELPPKLIVNGKQWLGRVYTVIGVSKSFIEKERVGAEVECYGHWRENAQYGMQFDAQFVNEKLPNSPEALEAFLSSGKIHGLGAHYAKLIVEKWGVGAIEMLDSEPQRLLEIGGIGEKRLDTIIKSWKTYRGVYGIMSFMQMHGIGDAVGLRIYNAFGENATRVIEQNPYALTSVPMVGFKTADRIARSLGVSPVAPFRISASLKFALEDSAKNEGHTALPFNDLVTRAADLLELTSDAPVAAVLDQALAAGQLVERRLKVRLVLRERFSEKIIESEQRCVSSKGLVTTEKRTAQELVRLQSGEQAGRLSAEEIEAAASDPESGLDASQIRALRNSFATKVSIVTGGPGTGKTHTIKTILRTALKHGWTVGLTAPTGRAAKRMEEATGHKASTMHRLLAYSPETGFKFNDQTRLDYDLLIVDESSMIDVWLLGAFLRAVPDHGAVIFVGDVDQLPSVGAGNCLYDMIQCGQLPVSRLEMIHRQAANSKIIVNAHKIIKKKFPDLHTMDEGFDFAFIEADGNDVIQEKMIKLCNQLLLEGVSSDEIQVITPQKGTEVGTQELNKVLRPVLNPKAKDFELSLEDGSKLRYAPGDRVMQFRNNYDLEVFNGDVGTVESVDEVDGTVYVKFDDRSVRLSGAQLKDIRLGYAITIHKSQGTEHGHVIIPMTRSHQFMISPNLLYTAVTRGKKRVYLIGERQVVYRTVSGQDRDFRFTGLLQEIKQAFDVKEGDGLFG